MQVVNIFNGLQVLLSVVIECALSSGGWGWSPAPDLWPVVMAGLSLVILHNLLVLEKVPSEGS